MDKDEKPYLRNYVDYCKKKVEECQASDPKRKLGYWKTALHNARLRLNHWEMLFWERIPENPTKHPSIEATLSGAFPNQEN